MGEYIVKRVLLAIVSILIVSAITFFVMNIIPGGPFNKEKATSVEAQKVLEERYNLDKPIPEQYVIYMNNLIHGDWNVFLLDRKDGNFTIAREGWLADYNDPVNMLEIFTSDSGNNDMQLGKGTPVSSSPDWTAYNDLISQIRTTTDFAARVDLMHQAEDMLMNTWAVIPIYYYNDVYMQKSNVTGIYATVYGMKYFMYATKSAQ